MASRGKRIGNMQGLKSKVAAEKAAQGALEENDGARRKLRKAVAARDAAYALDDGAEALVLRALDAFADRVAERRRLGPLVADEREALGDGRRGERESDAGFGRHGYLRGGVLGRGEALGFVLHYFFAA